MEFFGLESCLGLRAGQCARPGLERYRCCRSARASDGVEVVQHLPVRAQQACLAVGQTVVLAKLPDDWPCAAQVRSWHVGEQMVLDLVVEAAEEKVNQHA